MRDRIDYGGLMHRALRNLVAEVLAQVARDGLPGDHHFFITFATDAPGVEMADWLRERYPESMTIVIQNWFEDLEVDGNSFSVTLNFGDRPERIRVPLDALEAFVDPSVEFGLRFEPHADDDQPDEETAPPAPMQEVSEGDRGSEGAEIVSLDTFRRK